VAALAASGDATPAELHAFKTHAATCAACTAEAAAFDLLRRQLHSLGEAAAPVTVYAAVRARVVSEIEGRGRRRWVLAWSSLAAVAACGVIAVFALHRAAPVAEDLAVLRPPAASVAIASIQNDNSRISPPPEPHRIRKIARRIVPQETGAPTVLQPIGVQPIVVHMFTSDPDVVIYWVADATVKSSKEEFMQ
jgi:anti-sigma factor RsiW